MVSEVPARGLCPLAGTGMLFLGVAMHVGDMQELYHAAWRREAAFCFLG